VIYPFAAPLKEDAGFFVLKGNLFDFAIMKTSVISPEFRARYLSSRAPKTSSSAARWCSTVPTTTTTASTIRR
jgi:dihydroxyacid dehydratase/phosphogluconate dehydratase